MSEFGGAAVSTSRRRRHILLHAPATLFIALLLAPHAGAAGSALTIEPRPRHAPKESKPPEGSNRAGSSKAAPTGPDEPAKGAAPNESPQSSPDEAKPGAETDASARPAAEHETAAEPEASDTEAAEPEAPKPEAAKPESAKPEATAPPHGVAVDEEGLKLVAVHFRSGSKDLRFLLGPDRSEHAPWDTSKLGEELDMDQLRALCVAPCARWLYPGSYSVALARNGDPVRASEPISLDGPAVLEAEYHSFTWMRLTGYATMGASVVLGSLLVFSSVSDCGSTDGSCLQKEANVFIGAGVILAGLTGGLLMAQKSDEVSVKVRPAPAKLPEPP